jgi:hypothetical protein
MRDALAGVLAQIAKANGNGTVDMRLWANVRPALKAERTVINSRFFYRGT